MAKATRTLEATLTKNTSVEKGGAWLLTITDLDPVEEPHEMITHSAWANPSAAKRYLKAHVIETTPRKSIKMVVESTNEAGKPTHLSGEISWKVNA